MAKQVRQVSQARPAQTARTARIRGVTVVARAVGVWLRGLRGRTIALTAGAVAAVAALTVTAVLLFSHDDRPPVPPTRARAYTDVDACLLTGDKGVTADTTAATVWQGMQDASLKTHARVSYAQVTGEQSTGNARPFLNGLLQRSCDVVLAVGRPEVAAAQATAASHQKVAFVLVDGAHAGANVSTVAAGDGLRAGVAQAVEHAVGARG
jgi:basic membrane lipoprotein Med (substrate-binding protein (PBP1-ABC) superfamily)